VCDLGIGEGSFAGRKLVLRRSQLGMQLRALKLRSIGMRSHAFKGALRISELRFQCGKV
jgi:hypothetical protein